MVSKRGLGAGLIKDFEKIDNILNKVFSESDINISIKIRLGNENKEEIFNVLPIIDKYPIKNITIHPRIGKQKYKGEIDLESFKNCIENTNHKIIYNGNIFSVKNFKELAERFPTINTWMIGRGIIANPFLPEMIKDNKTDYPENKLEIFKKFHDTLFNDYQQALSGPSHIIIKMYSLWEYFIFLFPNSKKGLKKIKKAKNIEAFQNEVNIILNNE